MSEQTTQPDSDRLANAIAVLDTNQMDDVLQNEYSAVDEEEGTAVVGSTHDLTEVPIPPGDILAPVIDHVVDVAEDHLESPIELDVSVGGHGSVTVTAFHEIDRAGESEEVVYNNREHRVYYRYVDQIPGTDEFREEDTTTLERLEPGETDV